MRVGYSMWGFVGNGVVDTPDGSYAYRKPFLDRLTAEGNDIVLLQRNRDLLEAGSDPATPTGESRPPFPASTC